MNNSAREWLRRKLSPQAFANVCFGWWYYRSHRAGLGATFRGHPAPVIHSYPEGMAFRMPAEIGAVKTFAPTAMCRVMARHGSDKGTKHNYTTIYSVLFGKLRKRPLRIFELGLGTNNPHFASSMGVYGTPGAS